MADEIITLQEFFDKIQETHNAVYFKLNADHEQMSETDLAYDEGYLNALQFVLHTMSQNRIN